MDDIKAIREVVREEIAAEVKAIRDTLARHDRILEGNGRPGLERRMLDALSAAKDSVMEHITSREAHVKGNYQQADMLITARLDNEHRENQETMKANGGKTDRLTWLVAAGFGMVLTLQALLAAGVLRVGVK